MKLSVSNIAWNAHDDDVMYRHLHDMGFDGVEIAPTRVFNENPYTKNSVASSWATQLKQDFSLVVPSMQSILYGRTENIFGDEQQRQTLTEYLMRAIDFAQSIGCGNLVFGCPRNRQVSDTDTVMHIAIDFFRTLGDYAHEHDTFISIEANPPIYNTRFINTTRQAFDFCHSVNSPGLRVNLDLGTMVYNGEDASILVNEIDIINHVHISEPRLMPLERRQLHADVLDLLQQGGYQRFVSLEVGNTGNIDDVLDMMKYIKGLANE